ncbi:permease, partial [Candidatus Pacearchaeota archaeon]|nr:permease [Candidatus Pacearchaeota archaeon]
VFGIMFFVNLFLKPEKIKKHLGHESGIKGWVYTLFVGSFVPMGPPYVVFPLLGDLKKSGMRNSLIVAFLNIRNLQLIFLIVLISYFGLLFTLVLGIYVFIFAILNGVLIEKIL